MGNRSIKKYCTMFSSPLIPYMNIGASRETSLNMSVTSSFVVPLSVSWKSLAEP